MALGKLLGRMDIGVGRRALEVEWHEGGGYRILRALVS